MENQRLQKTGSDIGSIEMHSNKTIWEQRKIYVQALYKSITVIYVIALLQFEPSAACERNYAEKNLVAWQYWESEHSLF